MENAPDPASGATASPKATAGRARRNIRAEAAKRLARALVLAATLTAAAVYGFVFDKSIRPDPFTPHPAILDWLLYNQPHPALAQIPVVPIGATLTFRPKDTDWINRPDLPRARINGVADVPSTWTGKSSLYPLGRITYAQCMSDGSRCWLVRNDDEPAHFVGTDDGGKTWEGSADAGWRVLVFGFWGDGKHGWFSYTSPALDHVSMQTTDDGGITWKGAEDTQVRFADPYRSAWVQWLRRADSPASRIYASQVEGGFQLVDGRMLGVGLDGVIRVAAVGKPSGDSSGLPSETLADGEWRSFHFAWTQRAVADPVWHRWVAGDGGAIASIDESDHDGSVAEWSQKTVPTRASIRSIYFQPGERIGWIASGWDDDNEEGERPVVLQTINGGDTWVRLSYRHLPAPWLLYGVLPGLLLALYGAAVRYRSFVTIPPVIAGIEDTAITDAPIGWKDLDALDLQPIAKALSRYLRNRNTAPPLTVAVTGPWGTGKSSLMNLIAEDLRRFGTRPVWFNAWHHQQEEHLLAALLENIRGQVVPPWWRWEGVWFRLRLLYRRSRSDVTSLAAILFLLAVAAAVIVLSVEQGTLKAIWTWMDKLWDSDEFVAKIATALSGLGGIGAVGYVVLSALGRLKVLTISPANLLATARERSSLGAFSEQLGFRYKFAREFALVCQTLRAGRNAGVVIFIDDLDRCQPENVLVVLEAVNFLVSAGPCFIFLGIDEEKVITSVAQGFKDAIVDLPKDLPASQQAKANDTEARELRTDARALRRFSEKYLEKLINVVVPVPSATIDSSARLLGVANDTASTPMPPGQARRVRNSPWPERFRRAGRAATTLGALAIVAGVGSLLVAEFLPPLMPLVQDAPDATVSNASGAATSADVLDVGGDWPPDIGVPDVKAELLTPASSLPIALAIGLTVAAIALLLIRRSMRSPEEQIEDSNDFNAALAIWTPVIFSANPTPRGVKRLQNRLRLYAMRVRPQADPPDWADSLAKRFKLAAAAEQSNRILISEPTLVAMGSLDALDRALIECDHADLRNRLNARIGTPENASLGTELVARFEAKFAGAWPPSAEQVRIFRALTEVVQHR